MFKAVKISKCPFQEACPELKSVISRGQGGNADVISVMSFPLLKFYALERMGHDGSWDVSKRNLKFRTS